MEKTKNRSIGGISLCAIVIVGAALLLSAINPLQKAQEQLSNSLYFERSTKHPIVIVGIDNKSVSDDQGLGRQQEWSRDNYAQVIQNLIKYDPAVIGLDIFFRTKSAGISEEMLESALENKSLDEIRNDYLFSETHPEDANLKSLIEHNDNLVLINSGITLNSDIHQLNEKDINLIRDAIPPIFGFKNPEKIGHNFFIASLDGLIRQLAPVFKFGDKTYFAFSIRLAEKFLGNEDYQVQLNSDSLKLGSQANPLEIPLENFQMLINFTTKTAVNISQGYLNENVKTIPFVDVFNENYDQSFDPEYFRGKIVLIGAWNRSSGDNFFTPIDGQNAMPGVGIHAQAIQTILDQAWLYNQSFASQAGTIVILTLLCLALIFGIRIIWAIPALGLLLVLYAMAYAPLMFRQFGIIVNLVYPPLTIILAAIVGYAYRYVTEFRLKTKVATALGQFVNEEVAEKVLNSEDARVEKRGEKREITVIFTDIRGFTTISENLQPQSVVALLNEYLEAMAAVVVKNGGIIDKYEGDAIMAFFEDEEGQPPHQLRAAQTALDMRAELPKLLEKWRNDPPLPGGEKKPDIDFRVGLSSGVALVGTIGSTSHIQYTAIGDIVNLGSRLEGANKKYESHILLPEATFAAITNSFECRYVDNIKVKGKDKPVKIYQLMGRKGDLSQEKIELVLAYNKGIELYFERKFQEAADHFENILKKYPQDFLSRLYAARARKCVVLPPAPDWDFVYKMETK